MESLGEQSQQAWYVQVRVMISISLFLQTFLFFSAPFRRRMAKLYIDVPIWWAFVYVDVIAFLAIAIISNRVGNTSVSASLSNPELMAFWAPFLLVHLGGPDTITAFSLEDNELWIRHLLQLVSQCATIAYVIFLTLSSKNKLWLPTLLVFVAGFIKYIARIQSLYLASSRRFQDSLLTEPDPGPDYAQLMDQYSKKEEAKLPTQEHKRVPKKATQYNDEPRSLNDLEVLQHAYRFFRTFTGLIFNFGERGQSRIFFLNITARDAFKVVEVELNFFYEILYTKARVLQNKYGFLIRFLSFVLIMAALLRFYLLDKDEQEFHKIDVGITYTLLFGAIALDIIALVMVSFSDWATVVLTESNNPSLLVRMLRKSLKVNRQRWPHEGSTTQHCRTCSFGWFMQIVRRRWSESIGQYNLIHSCLDRRDNFSGFHGLILWLKNVQWETFTNDLRDFIFKELKMKSKMADDLETANEIYQARGDWVLRFEGCTDLLPWINEVDFDESLLVWHIATDLCIHSCEVSKKQDAKDLRHLSNILSNYMLYLLIMQSKMMAAVAGIGQIRFRDTCAEALKFFKERKIRRSQKLPACRSILDVNTAVKPVAVKGDRSKSVLFDACMLAKELEKLGEERQWVIISKVWVELLSYAACRSTALSHAAQLCKGGQLITYVWLLMSHLGLGDQFQVSGGLSGANVGK